MKARRGFALICSSSLALAGIVSAFQAAASDHSRELFVTHDQIVNGSLSAAARLDQQREEYAAYLSTLGLPELQNPRTRRQIAIFVLSGGSGAILRSVLAAAKPEDPQAKLIGGLLAHWEKRTEDAERLLLPLDPLTFDGVLGGHLALTQALISARTEPEQAIKSLNLARLLLPGTLVEEAALRHTIIICAKHTKTELFSRAAEAYFRRFSHSAYAPGFRKQFIVLLSRMRPASPEAFVGQLYRAMAMTKPGSMAKPGIIWPAEFFVVVLEEAIRGGNLELGAAVARHLERHIIEPADLRRRVLLFKGAALILSDKYVEGVSLLKSINRSELFHRDAIFLDTTLDVAARIRQPALDALHATPTARTDKPNLRIFASSVAAEKANKRLGEIDRLLELKR